MSISTSLATVVGVSFVSLVEKGEDDRVSEAGEELGLDVWFQMPRFDTLTDMYVGVVFYGRPSDADVAAATAKVTAALPALTERLGPPSSGVVTWSGVCIS